MVVPGDGCAGVIRGALIETRAVSSGNPAGLFDPGGVGTGNCIENDRQFHSIETT